MVLFLLLYKILQRSAGEERKEKEGYLLALNCKGKISPEVITQFDENLEACIYLWDHSIRGLEAPVEVGAMAAEEFCQKGVFIFFHDSNEGIFGPFTIIIFKVS